MAENFQEMYLKIVLDRLEFVSEFVPLGRGAESCTSTSTFYLLLPVILQEYENVMTVDWKTVRRCLCSPIFRHPADIVDQKVFPLDTHLQLANGFRSVRDVENSLVYAPHRQTFYFVTYVIYGKNGFSPYKDSGTSSYVDHFVEKYVSVYYYWFILVSFWFCITNSSLLIKYIYGSCFKLLFDTMNLGRTITKASHCG